MTWAGPIAFPEAKAPPARIEPLSLAVRRLRADEAALAGRIAATALDFDVDLPEIGGLRIRLDKAPRRRVDMVETLSLTCAGVAFRVALSEPLLRPLLEARRLGDELAALCPDPGLAALVIEHLLSPVLAGFEQRTGMSVALTDIAPGEGPTIDIPSNAISLRLECRLWPGPVAATVWSDAPEADAVLSGIAATCPERGVNQSARGAALAAPLSVSLRGPDLAMDRRDATALRPGDGILLPVGADLVDELTLVLGNRLRASCRIAPEAGGVRISRPPVRGNPDTTEEADMTASTDGPEENGTRIDDLPITLSVEIDRTEVTFGELERMWTGSIVAFEGDGEQTIRILANGRGFATGELVAIEEEDGRVRQGIRILRFADRREFEETRATGSR